MSVSHQVAQKTWRTLFIDIFIGYVLLLIFILLVQWTQLSFLIKEDKHNPTFNQGRLYEAVIGFLIVYSIYTIGRVIVFSLRKNIHFNKISALVCHFIDDYAWCLYVCYFPFLLCIPEKYSELNYIHDKGELIFRFYTVSVFLSQYLIPMILIQRMACFFYVVIRKKKFENITEESLQLPNKPEYSTLRLIFNPCAVKIRNEFFYRIAVLVFLTTIPILVMKMNTWLLAITSDGSAAFKYYGDAPVLGVGSAFMFDALEKLTVMIICCVLFFVVARNILIALYHCARLASCPLCLCEKQE